MESNFTVVYSFQVHQGKEEQFIQSWKNLTNLIYENRGSLGSCLHRLNDLEFIAYAVWPNRETFEDVSQEMPAVTDQVRSAMREACSKIETIYQMDVVEDLLKAKAFNK